MTSALYSTSGLPDPQDACVDIIQAETEPRLIRTAQYVTAQLLQGAHVYSSAMLEVVRLAACFGKGIE